MEPNVRSFHARILTEALDNEGRYDAVKLAQFLDWNNQEIAQYLDRDPSTISRYGASPQYQQALSQLAALVVDLLKLLDGDLRLVRAWLRTPVQVLGESPKEKILHHDLRSVGSLLQEVESGFSV
jgi:hypothetical protein